MSESIKFLENKGPFGFDVLGDDDAKPTNRLKFQKYAFLACCGMQLWYRYDM